MKHLPCGLFAKDLTTAAERRAWRGVVKRGGSYKEKAPDGGSFCKNASTVHFPTALIVLPSEKYQVFPILVAEVPSE